jgi:hypothetical protein
MNNGLSQYQVEKLLEDLERLRNGNEIEAMTSTIESHRINYDSKAKAYQFVIRKIRRMINPPKRSITD